MEPVEHEREYEYEDEEGGYEQGEYEWDGYDCDQANGYEGEGNGGEGWSGRGGYPEGWCGYRSQDEHEDPMTEGEDKDEDEGVSVHGRRRNRKPRQPYTVTLALRKNNWFESSMGWEDNHFRTAYRMSKDSFWGIVDILKNNAIFKSSGRKKQRPVHYQLGVFLLRYGVVGSRARHPMLLTSVGEGTVTLYCRRVIRAVREHGQECVVWPEAEQKEEIKRGFKKMCGLDGIIGSLDGTLCGLATKPRVGGDSYISRKKTLSVNVQAWTDHRGLFIAFHAGWPGSRPDVSVWPNTWVFKEKDRLFAPGEFLLADGGYTISPIVLTPFARNELGSGSEGRRRREFNRRISGARIVVEWAFGRLKARFPALKRLGAARDMKDIYRAIQATMILHNMCYQLGDAPDGLCTGLDEEADDESGSEDGDEQGEIDCSDMTYLEAGRAHRLHYLDMLCPQ